MEVDEDITICRKRKVKGGRREKALSALGLRVIRFGNDEAAGTRSGPRWRGRSKSLLETNNSPLVKYLSLRYKITYAHHHPQNAHSVLGKTPRQPNGVTTLVQDRTKDRIQ